MADRPELITITDPRSAASEAYRTLRTNLTFAALDGSLDTLVVTAPTPEEDKSTVLANLAVTLAQMGKRTLLVDADLRRPKLHEIFGVTNERGITTMFVEDTSPDDPPVLDVDVENLSLLSSGPLPPNPADILGSQKMEDIIDALTRQYDIVLFDAPPVISVTDAAVLGAKTEGVLLVVHSGQTRREHVERAKEQLERVHVRIVGTVLTDAPKDVTLGGY